MPQARQPNYVFAHTKTLALLVLTVVALTSINEACRSKEVNLKDETWSTELKNLNSSKYKNLAGSIKTALNNTMNNTLRNLTCGPLVTKYYHSSDSDFPGVIAKLSIAVNVTKIFENKLLTGIVYNNSQNYTMTPASRIFVASFDVSQPANATMVTADSMVIAVKSVLSIMNRTVTVNESMNPRFTLTIWMNRTEKYPSRALKDLAEAVRNGDVNGINVNSSSFMAYSAFPKPTTKIFELKFNYSVAQCYSDKSSNEYEVFEKNVSDFVNKTLNNSTEYIEILSISLKCSLSNSRSARVTPTTVNVVAKYELSQDLDSVANAMLDCGSSNSMVTNLQVKLLNPSSFKDPQTAKGKACPTDTPVVSTTSKKPQPTKGTTKTTTATQPPLMGKTPRLFARLRLALTWSQFCSKLEQSLKESIAKNVHDKNGNAVSSDRVIFINARKNCADPSKTNEQVDLWFYITNDTASERPSKCITLKAYRVLKLMVDNGNTNLLGPDFKGKVVGLNLAGCDAKEFDNKDKMDDWVLILIIIAVIIGAILLLLACCCICCGAARRRRRRRHRDKYGNVEMVVVDADGNSQANGAGGKGRRHGKRHHRGGPYGGGRGYGYSDSDDSDDYLCFGGRGGRGRGQDGDYDSDDDRRGRKRHGGRRGRGHDGDYDSDDDRRGRKGGDGSGDGNINGVDGAGKKGRGRKKGRRSGDDYDSDSDVDYLCGGKRKGRRTGKDKDRKNKNKSGDDAGDGKGDSKGNKNLDAPKDDKGRDNAGYESLRSDGDKKASGQPVSYQNLSYGLGDRKPSADEGYTSLLKDGRGENTYATVDEASKRQSRGSSIGGHDYEKMEGGARKNGAGGTGAGTGSAGGAAVLLAGSMADGNKRGSLTPAIVTSPAPDTGPQTNIVTSGSPGPRRGSGSKGGSPTGSRPSSGTGLGNLDDELQRERRRSSIHSLLDDDAEPLKHKTGTVGIVGLALRNKNEKKKETEFKNLDKDMPALGTYPASTAGKNRNPDILPNPRSRVKLSSSPDYINASYLHDHKGQRHYIATQHPLLESKHDFWQMVWDTESCLIVMVNDDENSSQMDYPQYWPATEGSSVDFNGIVVSNKQVITKTDYIITNLVVTNTKTKPSTTREISHYRYTSWKEKDVPNIAMFVGFVMATREVGRKYEDGKSPVVVHCSDGQGFTGVFIALDIGIRSHEENKTSVVDLYELAKRLRQGRNGIINSLQLYNFTYQCLYEYTVNYDEEAEKKK